MVNSLRHGNEQKTQNKDIFMPCQMTHGGKREGAGRKPAFEPSILVQVRIPESWTKAMGDNRRKFVRDAIKRAVDDNPTGGRLGGT